MHIAMFIIGGNEYCSSIIQWSNPTDPSAPPFQICVHHTNETDTVTELEATFKALGCTVTVNHD